MEELMQSNNRRVMIAFASCTEEKGEVIFADVSSVRGEEGESKRT